MKVNIATSTPWKARNSPTVWGLALAYALSIPAAFLIPPDIFSTYPVAQEFTEFMQKLVPMIERIGAYRPPQPERLKLYMALMWALLSPILIIAASLELNREKPVFRKKITVEALFLGFSFETAVGNLSNDVLIGGRAD